jgi:hypothetical protein
VNIAQCSPTSYPGDLVIDCHPSYIKPSAIPFSHAAIDDHVMKFPLPTSGGDQHPAVTITHYHQKAEQEKFHGPTVSNHGSTYSNGEMIIRALNDHADQNVVLLPFIVDPFRGLGPIANAFLFGLSPHLPPPHLVFDSPTSQTAYDNATSPLGCPAALMLTLTAPPPPPISHLYLPLLVPY